MKILKVLLLNFLPLILSIIILLPGCDGKSHNETNFTESSNQPAVVQPSTSVNTVETCPYQAEVNSVIKIYPRSDQISWFDPNEPLRVLFLLEQFEIRARKLLGAIELSEYRTNCLEQQWHLQARLEKVPEKRRVLERLREMNKEQFDRAIDSLSLP